MKPATHLCDLCGHKMARTQMRPPAYLCSNPRCEPLRPLQLIQGYKALLRSDCWAELIRSRISSKNATGGLVPFPHAPPLPADYPGPRGTILPTYAAGVFLRYVYAMPIEAVALAKDEFSALTAWRVTKRVYRFHPALRDELTATPIESSIPVDVLWRLPVWCPYVEYPFDVDWSCSGREGHEHGDTPCPASRAAGFYAFFDAHPCVGGDLPLLRILLDLEDANEPMGLLSAELAMQPGLSIRESYELACDWNAAYLEQAAAFGQPVAPCLVELLQLKTPHDDRIFAALGRVVSLLLYLCADNADVPGRTEPLATRVIDRPPGFIEAPKTSVIKCGELIGGKLQKAREEYERIRYSNPRSTMAPHVRAAHWHSFWTGPRTAERKLVLRWLAPILVNAAQGTIAPTVLEAEAHELNE